MGGARGDRPRRHAARHRLRLAGRVPPRRGRGQPPGAAEEVLADFDERVAALRAEIEQLPPIEVALLGSFEPGVFWWWEPEYEANQHLQSVGIAVDGPAERGRDVSYERLGEVTAPWIILTGTPGSEDGTDDLTSSALWATLPAVQRDQVVIVDRDLWGGAGVLWAQRLLDDIERIFVPSQRVRRRASVLVANLRQLPGPIATETTMAASHGRWSELLATGDRGGLDAVAGAELAQDVGDVDARRLAAHEELCTDLPVSDSELDGMLRTGSVAPPGFTAIRYDVEIDTAASPADVDAMAEEADRLSPMLDAVGRANRLVRSVTVVDGAR